LETIDFQVDKALGTRAGGKVVEAYSFGQDLSRNPRRLAASLFAGKGTRFAANGRPLVVAVFALVVFFNEHVHQFSASARWRRAAIFPGELHARDANRFALHVVARFLLVDGFHLQLTMLAALGTDDRRAARAVRAGAAGKRTHGGENDEKKTSHWSAFGK
jgi:hypothetical protein